LIQKSFVLYGNFGGVKRKRQGNVFRKMQKSLSRPILGIGCAAHTLNNIDLTARDALSIDVKIIAAKVFSHFSVYCQSDCVKRILRICKYTRCDQKIQGLKLYLL